MRSLMIVPLAAILYLALAPVSGANQAWCAPSSITEIRILKNVTVNQKEVSLAEICDLETLSEEWKSIMRGLNIGDAPPVGSEKFIDPAQLRAYLVRLIESRGIESSELKLDIPERIVIRRESVQITQEQVETIFKQFVLENSPWQQQEISIQRVRFTGVPVIPAGVMRYEMTVSPKERYIGNVTASIDFYVNGEKARTLGVVGRVEVMGNVFLASRPIKQNEMIGSADLQMKKINITDAADRFATRPDQVENRRALRNIGTHQPIELKDLDKPLVLKRGDPVMIVYDQPGLQLTAKGQVSADGGIGDTLAVMNVSSKKTVHCKVLDAQTVRVTR